MPATVGTTSKKFAQARIVRKLDELDLFGHDVLRVCARRHRASEEDECVERAAHLEHEQQERPIGGHAASPAFDDLVDGVEVDTEAVFGHSGQRGGGQSFVAVGI